MIETIGVIDLLYGTYVYGKKAYELAPSIAKRLIEIELNPVVIDVKSWPSWIKAVGGSLFSYRLLELMSLDQLIDVLCFSLNLDERGRAVIGAILSRFFRTSPSITIFGLTGFLDSLETNDYQVRGIAERLKELMMYLSSASFGKDVELDFSKPILLDLSEFKWEAARRVMYSLAAVLALKNYVNSNVIVLCELDSWLRGAMLREVEMALGKVPVIAICEEDVGLDFLTKVRVDGDFFEITRGRWYKAKGFLDLERYEFREEVNDMDLLDSREAYEILKALEDREAALEGLSAYLPHLSGILRDVLKSLGEEGMLVEKGGRYKITDKGLDQLRRLAEYYE